MASAANKTVLDRATDLLMNFGEVLAVGLSGSRARNAADAYSDFDLVVFMPEEVPPEKHRRKCYHDAGFDDLPYFDIHCEAGVDDALMIDKYRCQIVWMSLPCVESYLEALDTDFDCDEFLPGGILQTVPLLDPDHVIDQLKSDVPPYCRARSEQRLKNHLRDAHASIYGQGWLEKAVQRGDYFSFRKHLDHMLDHFIICVFALNRTWYCEEKRLVTVLDDFELVPAHAGQRLNALLMHTGENADLSASLDDLKELFMELAALAQYHYPDVRFPLDWA